MDNAKLVENWHKAIISICEKKLARDLTGNESKFIISRGGFMALELIEGAVIALPPSDLESYLNSEG